MARFVSRSADETRVMGARLAKALPDGTVVALTGELGSGKTTFVQGAAEGLGVARGADDLGETEGVTSPTFVLVREHEGSGGRRLVHVDAHRLRSAAELRDLGSDDFLRCRGVAFVEWAERVEGALPEPRLALSFTHEAEGVRAIEVEGVGEGAAALVEAAERALAGDEDLAEDPRT
ncbi:MAG: tRNA (adenosine(37)-N6)-threonylcarbamoyltransferase complex ATPase subunit type 1 TsaE [Planctomycetota bacterium]